MLGLGFGLAGVAARGGVDPAGIIGFQQVLDWIRSGIWDDRAPTSDAWSAAVGWLFSGQWDDAAPTGAATWSSPDATAYTIWADTEATV